jgi:hypothetical protein
MRTTLIIACAIVVFAAGAQAQDALKPCRQIKDDGKRLKRYDRLDRTSSNARERLGQRRPGGDTAWVITSMRARRLRRNDPAKNSSDLGSIRSRASCSVASS